MHELVEGAVRKFDPVATAVASRREPDNEELTLLFSGLADLAALAVDALIRIADSAESISGNGVNIFK